MQWSDVQILAGAPWLTFDSLFAYHPQQSSMATVFASQVIGREFNPSSDSFVLFCFVLAFHCLVGNNLHFIESSAIVEFYGTSVVSDELVSNF